MLGMSLHRSSNQRDGSICSRIPKTIEVRRSSEPSVRLEIFPRRIAANIKKPRLKLWSVSDFWVMGAKKKKGEMIVW